VCTFDDEEIISKLKVIEESGPQQQDAHTTRFQEARGLFLANKTKQDQRK
jgi:hypothetical protein